MKRRDPGVLQLAKRYNTICDTLRKLSREGKAPRGARCPEPVNIKGIFNLDVDDAIWQDVGLFDDDDCDIPRWLGEENVRKGINLLLQVKRCREELNRLAREKIALREWFLDLWSRTSLALRSSGTLSLLYGF